jgi:hypothetical protein
MVMRISPLSANVAGRRNQSAYQTLTVGTPKGSQAASSSAPMSIWATAPAAFGASYSSSHYAAPSWLGESSCVCFRGVGDHTLFLLK